MEFDKYFADLESQPITGYLHSGEHINIPLISHVVDNLYVGGHSAHVDLGDYFTHVFSFYVFEDKYKTGPDTIHEGFHMYDSRNHPDVETLDDAVPKIVAALEAGGNVLVHCQAGINRSNLAATLVLREWKGLTSREAVDMLREKRSENVLANRTFLHYLYRLDLGDQNASS